MSKESNVVLKKELVKRIAERTMLPAGEVKLILNAFEEVLKESLKEGKKVKITGFGTFSLVRRKGKTVKAPTGKVVKVADRLAPKFTFSAAFVREVRKEL